MDLGLQVSERDGRVVLHVTGEIDVATAPRLRERTVALVAQGQRHLVIDLDGVDFLDSTGLGVLVGTLKRLRSQDGTLALVCSRPSILKVFEITELTKIFDMHPSIDAALRAP
jgi:anti-sigma B factor antagonist